jgi:hypothetical protein
MAGGIRVRRDVEVEMGTGRKMSFLGLTRHRMPSIWSITFPSELLTPVPADEGVLRQPEVLVLAQHRISTKPDLQLRSSPLYRSRLPIPTSTPTTTLHLPLLVQVLEVSLSPFPSAHLPVIILCTSLVIPTTTPRPRNLSTESNIEIKIKIRMGVSIPRENDSTHMAQLVGSSLCPLDLNGSLAQEGVTCPWGASDMVWYGITVDRVRIRIVELDEVDLVDIKM